MTVVAKRAIAFDSHQLAVAARERPGPSLLTGSPGTGKTAVALHRLSILAAAAPGPLLFLAPRPELARTQAIAYRRSYPATATRVGFRSVSEWAGDLVLRRGPDFLAADPVAEVLRGPTPRYASVVVDEAQDLTTAELRLVHLLGGQNLLLVASSPGQWLARSGIALTGGVDTLAVNYRNSSAVLAALGSTRVDGGVAAVAAVARGAAGPASGSALRYLASCQDDQDAELVAALRACPAPAADMALLTVERADAVRYLRALHIAQIPATALAGHPGHRVEAVKVGTVADARGLEFRAVFLPGLPVGPAADRVAAISRAREHVWIGTVPDRGRHL